MGAEEGADKRLDDCDPTDSLSLARFFARICEDKLATDVGILDLRAFTALTDYFVIATGRNRRQLQSIADEIKLVSKNGLSMLPRGLEGYQEGSWILIDYHSVVVHLFQEDTRSFYDLDLLWGDAPLLEWRDAASSENPQQA